MRMTSQEINMFGPTPAVLRMAYIWHCILYLRKDAVCFIVSGNQTFASFSYISWNTQSRQNFQDCLFRRWEFHCNKLFTITAFYAAEGNTFLLISWTETWSVMLVYLNKKYYFSLRLVCLSNWYIYIWNLWFIVIF